MDELLTIEREGDSKGIDLPKKVPVETEATIVLGSTK